MSVIKDTKQQIKEIYHSRNILRSLVEKNLYGRYKNSLLGFAWHFIIPIIMMVVYYIVFTSIRTNSLPNFWIFISSGIFPFSFMLTNITSGSGCIISNAGMIKKMYFPREIIALAQVISSFIVVIIGYIIVLVVVIASNHPIGMPIIFLPIMLILMFLFVTGYVFLLSSITVYIRDIQHFLSSISMVFFFMTPMYFEAKSITGPLSTIIWFNPLTYYVESFHQIIYYSCIPDTYILAMCILLPIVFLTVGAITFTKLKHGFTERL